MDKLKVTLPDGKVNTRTTNHPYTHVVIVHFDGSARNRNKHWDGWQAISWHKNSHLANKASLSWPIGQYGVLEVRVIPVDAPEKDQPKVSGRTAESRFLKIYQALYDRVPVAGYDYCSRGLVMCGCQLPTYSELITKTLKEHKTTNK